MELEPGIRDALSAALLAFATLVARLLEHSLSTGSRFTSLLHPRPQGGITSTSQAATTSSTQTTTTAPPAPKAKAQPKLAATTTCRAPPDSRLLPDQEREPLIELVEELTEQSGDCYNSCLSRILRAFDAGLAAYRKFSGEISRVPATPSLATIQRRLAQPSPKWYFVLFVPGTGSPSLHRSWEDCKAVVGWPADNRAIFHSFHFRSEVEAYLLGADRPDLVHLLQ